MKIRNIILLSGVILSSVSSLNAQISRSIDAEDRKILSEKAEDLYKVVDPLVNEISSSVVLFKVNDRVVSLGTVTKKGIVTKFSEISKYANDGELHIVTKDGTVHKTIELLGVYESYDIAVLKNVGSLPAVDFTESVTPEVGSFIVASTASEQALAMGVVSVKPRSLKQKDRGFLGVVMDMSDTVLTINGDPVTNMLEMRNFLQQLAPGDNINISFKRGDVVSAGVKVELGARKETPRVRRSRMNNMKKMGGRVNEVSEGFPRVLQTDMQIRSRFCGAPVVNLDGETVGVVISKSSRIKAYILEGKILEKLLNTTPDR